MCGVELARNGRYLVATNLVDGAAGSMRPARLQLSLCRSYVKKYDHDTSIRIETSEWKTMKEVCQMSSPRHVDTL